MADKSIWWCEQCHASGVVTHSRSVGAWEVAEAIAAAHDGSAIRKLLNCQAPSSLLRVQLVQRSSRASRSDGRPSAQTWSE